jgi:hypothetical protein
VTAAPDTVERLAADIERLLAEPHFFVDVVAIAPEGAYRDLLRAWGRVRARTPLARDEEGRYVVARAAAREAR